MSCASVRRSVSLAIVLQGVSSGGNIVSQCHASGVRRAVWCSVCRSVSIVSFIVSFIVSYNVCRAVCDVQYASQCVYVQCLRGACVSH